LLIEWINFSREATVFKVQHVFIVHFKAINFNPESYTPNTVSFKGQSHQILGYILATGKLN
jgi:hypothetical protein